MRLPLVVDSQLRMLAGVSIYEWRVSAGGRSKGATKLHDSDGGDRQGHMSDRGATSGYGIPWRIRFRVKARLGG